MINKASLDPSRRLDLFFRINREGSISFTFTDSDDNALSLIYEEFELYVKRFPGDRKNTISLSLGSGLSISDNVLTATVTNAQSNVDEEGEYYWELYRSSNGRTWISGNAYFHNGVFDNDENEDIQLLVTDPTPLSIIVN